MEVSFELKFFINGKVIEKANVKVSGDDKSVIRESLFTALDKCKSIALDKVTTKIDRAK